IIVMAIPASGSIPARVTIPFTISVAPVVGNDAAPVFTQPFPLNDTSPFANVVEEGFLSIIWKDVRPMTKELLDHWIGFGGKLKHAGGGEPNEPVDYHIQRHVARDGEVMDDG